MEPPKILAVSSRKASAEVSGCKTQAEGIAKQVSGTAQDMYGQARYAAFDIMGANRDGRFT